MSFQRAFNSDFSKLVDEVMEFIKLELQRELKDQGHVNTGKLLRSIEYVTTVTGNAIVSTMYLEDYWENINFGVPASRIPYSGPGGGGKSKYIGGLINYFQSKGKSLKQARSFAFATANVHRREGMPTRDSFRYSKNGNRTGFLTNTLENNLVKFEELISNKAETPVVAALDAIAKKFESQTV